ncbi:hypothetical protein BZG01_02960 [Labilibaculum manganireducens]|uniref:Uncharacterized protein n=1 Tax=Labilibaculum manganireducens TaxID=1940525 RepID=A0A2N3IEG8_9BACT|nr:hypothetical protein [Labilibaculum manganireducens]PKQ68696.1 hypothetical protein BZG01_02960 [Labilibaculum manganireducens]
MTIDLTINERNIDSDFQRIAFDLMNHWILKVQSKAYRITEIEFYFKSDSHNDKYIHGHKLQMEKERWYFHGSGVDITFGTNRSYGSILIRAIYDYTNDSYIYGPLNCVTELFSNIDFVYETNISFGLVNAEPPDFEIEKPISAPRVGLNPQKDKENFDAFYRYLIMPKKRHAEKSKIAQGMKQQKYLEEQIKEIWG